MDEVLCIGILLFALIAGEVGINVFFSGLD